MFVADSQSPMENANIESLNNLRINLSEDNRDLDDIPLVFQYNKQDLKNISPSEKLNELLKEKKLPYYESVAREGSGVVETLREISTLTLKKIKAEIENMSKNTGKKPVISFDLNQKKEMLDKKDLAIKRISVSDNRESLSIEENNLKKETEDFNFSETEINIDEIIESENVVSKPEQGDNTEKFEKADFKLLNKLTNDDSRITILKKINIKDSCSIEFKDKDSKLIKDFKINIKPGVKKINLIIDVED